MIDKIIRMLNMKADSQEEKYKIDQLSKDIKKIEKLNDICELLKTEIPDVFEDKKFILELVNIDANLIKYDETNDPEIYKIALKLKRDFFEENITEEDRWTFSNKKFLLKNIDEIIKELENPKEAPEGRYKIPKNILFQIIKENIVDPDWLESVLSEYFEIDCNYPKEYCERIEKLYYDDKNVLIRHEIDNSYAMSVENIEDTRDIIFTEGLRGYRSSGRENRLSATTVANMPYMDANESNLIERIKPATIFDFFTATSSIFISVPKEMVTRELPIWYSNYPEVDTEHHGFIPAKYVVGYTNNPKDIKDKVFIDNDVPLSDRVEYTYAFIDGDTINVVDKLYANNPWLEQYADPNYKNNYNEKFCGTPDDRIQCLFIARILSVKDIDLLCAGGVITQECKEKLYQINKLLNLSEEEVDKLPNKYISTINVLKSNKIRRVFANPIDEYGDTVFTQLADLVMSEELSNEDFINIRNLGLIPTNLIDSQSERNFIEHGLTTDSKRTVITLNSILKNALEVTTATKADEAVIVEQTVLNPETINKEEETHND